MEMSPIRGGILANDCGLGKTNTYLATIYMDVRDLKTRHERGEEGLTFHPTMIVMPSHLIPQVFDEIATNFKGLLVPHLYYGTLKGSSDPFQQRALLDSVQWRAWMKKMMYERLNPEVCSPHLGILRYKRSIRPTLPT